MHFEKIDKLFNIYKIITKTMKTTNYARKLRQFKNVLKLHKKMSLYSTNGENSSILQKIEQKIKKLILFLKNALRQKVVKIAGLTCLASLGLSQYSNAQSFEADSVLMRDSFVDGHKAFKFIDMDSDGDLDLFANEHYRYDQLYSYDYLTYFKNESQGNQISFVFQESNILSDGNSYDSDFWHVDLRNFDLKDID